MGVLKGELRVKTAEAEAAQGKVAALMLKLGGAGGGVKARCAAVRAVAASMARVAGGKHRGGGGASGAGGAGMHSSLLTLSALHPVAAAPAAAAAATAAAAAAQASEVEKLRGQLESAAQAMMERERHVEELERRLAGRGDDLRSLQGLMGRRDVLLSKQHHSGAPAQGEAAGAAAAGGGGRARAWTVLLWQRLRPSLPLRAWPLQQLLQPLLQPASQQLQRGREGAGSPVARCGMWRMPLRQ